MIKNILVGYGGSRGAQVALGQALEIALAAGARLRLALVETVADSAAETGLVTEVAPEAMLLAAAVERAEVEPDSLGASPALEVAATRCREAGVPYSLARYYGDPGERLLELSRLANLVVIGRRGDGSRYRRSVLGRHARKLAANAQVPTWFADRELLPLRAVTLYYEPRPGGGRALASAAELCSLMNLTLNVMVTGGRRLSPAEALAEAQFALRAYHLEGELLTADRAGADAVQNAALLWGDPLVVVPGPAPGGLIPDFSVIRAALATPNSNVLLVP